MSALPDPPPDYRELLARYEGAHWWLAGMRQITWAMLGPARGRLLDVGCGPGRLLTELPAGLWGVGVDLQVAFAVGRPILQAEVSHLPFADAIFDIITALDLLEQACVEPALALAEMRRVLTPAGRLLVRVPAHPQLYGPHDLIWGGARRYRRDELATLLRHAGFAVQRLTYANSLLFLTSATARLAARQLGFGGYDLRPLPARLNRLLLGVLQIEAHWLRRHDLWAGLSLICLAVRTA